MTDVDVIDAEIIDEEPGRLVPIPAPVFTIAVRPGKTAEDTAVEDWLDEQRSPHTRRSYASAIEQWRAWLARYDCCSLGLPHRRHAFDWRASMKDAGLKPKTIDSRLVAARSFYDYLCDLPGSPLIVNPIKSKKLLLNTGVHQRTKALAEEEVKALTAAAKSKIQDSPTTGLVRGNDQRLLIAFLATTGCRIKEAIGLRVEDLDRQAGQPIATVTIKGGDRRPISVDPHVFDMLMRHSEGWPPDWHVFQPHRAAGRNGAGYSYSGAYRLVQSASIAAGLVKKGVEGEPKKARVHPHMLRATFITQAIDAGMEITDVQDQVNHSMTETTRGYDNGARRHRRMAKVVGVLAEMVDLEDESAQGSGAS